MSAENGDTKVRVLIELPGNWKAKVELEGKGLDDSIQRLKRPLNKLFHNVGGRLLIALFLSLSNGDNLIGQTIILAILPGISIEKKDEQ